MGGRGASSSGGDGLPAKFRSVLGRKGTPRSVGTALKTANPKYNEDRAYRINCQRCIWAYELQRRGYKVQARGNPGDDFNHWDNKDGFSHVFEDAEFKPVHWWAEGRTPSLPMSKSGTKAQRMQVARNIEKQMREWGEGSRAAVTVGWQRSKSGHAFSIENIGGKVYIVDAQPGKKMPLMDYIDRANLMQTFICRTDNLSKPNYKALKKAVKPI